MSSYLVMFYGNYQSSVLWATKESYHLAFNEPTVQMLKRFTADRGTGDLHICETAVTAERYMQPSFPGTVLLILAR